MGEWTPVSGSICGKHQRERGWGTFQSAQITVGVKRFGCKILKNYHKLFNFKSAFSVIEDHNLDF